MPSSKDTKHVVFNVSTSFKIIELIGQGAYGVVCMAEHRTTGTKVAIKKINAFSNSLVCLRTLREIKLLSQLSQHENIVGLYDIQTPSSYKTFDEVYLIQEYMPFDLHHVIRGQRLTDDHVQYFTYQILRGLKYLHLANVIHRDLKPSNILVNKNCDVKICDLGLSRLDTKDVPKQKNFSLLTEYVATRWYRAPEIMLSISKYSKAVDMWSVGCILAELFIAEPLFPGRDFKHQLLLIFQLIGSPINNDEDFNSIKSIRAREFVKTLLVYYALNFDEVFQYHPNRIRNYGNEMINPVGIDLIKKLLVFNPDKRDSVDMALCHPYLSVYHDCTDEPTTSPIPVDEFEFDKDKEELDIEEMKQKMYKIISGNK